MASKLEDLLLFLLEFWILKAMVKTPLRASMLGLPRVFNIGLLGSVQRVLTMVQVGLGTRFARLCRASAPSLQCCMMLLSCCQGI